MILDDFRIASTNQADEFMALPTFGAGALHHVKFEEVSATSLAVKRQYVAGRSFANGLL
jgi:hypothetical protein